MTTIPLTITLPALATTAGAAVSRFFSACADGFARYFARRAAIEHLRELDDAALRDIGLARSQIEAALTCARGRPMMASIPAPDAVIGRHADAYARLPIGRAPWN